MEWIAVQACSGIKAITRIRGSSQCTTKLLRIKKTIRKALLFIFKAWITWIRTRTKRITMSSTRFSSDLISWILATREIESIRFSWTSSRVLCGSRSTLSCWRITLIWLLRTTLIFGLMSWRTRLNSCYTSLRIWLIRFLSKSILFRWVSAFSVVSNILRYSNDSCICVRFISRMRVEKILHCKSYVDQCSFAFFGEDSQEIKHSISLSTTLNKSLSIARIVRGVNENSKVICFLTHNSRCNW